jgi:hypothetical protein
MLRRGEEKGHFVFVTQEYLLELLSKQNYRCALSGRPIGFNDGENGCDTASPDRIDSNGTYSAGNIQWVHKDFNKLKNSWSQETFVVMCEEVVNNLASLKAATYVGEQNNRVNVMFDNPTVISEAAMRFSATASRLSYAAPLEQTEQLYNLCRSKSEEYGVMSFVMLITPAFAKVMLEHNIANRRKSPVLIKKYANDIANGNWAVNGEAIIVAKTGELNGGQHRLEGCILANRPFESLVVWGVDRATRTTLDTGRKKTAGDHLHSIGYSNAKTLAQAAKLAIYYDNRQTMVERPDLCPTQSDINEYLEMNPDLAENEDYVRIGQRVWKTFGASMGLYMTLAFLFARYDEDKTAEFFDKLFNGANLSKGSPVLALRDALFRENKNKRRAVIADLGARSIKAFNAYCEGRSVGLLLWRSQGNAPEPFPLIGR